MAEVESPNDKDSEGEKDGRLKEVESGLEGRRGRRSADLEWGVNFNQRR